MPKPFMTYDQQIAKLKEKQLIIPDDAKAKEELRRVGYYALITGYKELFKNCSKILRPAITAMARRWMILWRSTILMSTYGS